VNGSNVGTYVSFLGSNSKLPPLNFFNVPLRETKNQLISETSVCKNGY